MKLEMIKMPGGTFVPASDIVQEKLNRFKTGELYEVDIKLVRNPVFHRKVFAFFNFCFQYWSGENEFTEPVEQFNVFRKHLTCLAGYYDTFTNIHGEIRIEPKSLSYGNMSQEEFEACYKALINAAMKHVFRSDDQSYYNELMSFF